MNTFLIILASLFMLFCVAAIISCIRINYKKENDKK